MIMTDEPKNLASLVMARISPPKEEEAPAPEDPDMGAMAASEDMMQSIKDSDPRAFMQAMQAFISLCK